MKKCAIITIIVMAFSILSASCQKDTRAELDSYDKKNTMLLGYSQIGNESAWRTYQSTSIKKSAADAGIQLIFEDGEQKQENQIKALRSFVAYQVDVIAVSPVIETGWDNVLNEAGMAGIPVILVDRKVKVEDESLYKCFIGSDFEAEGHRAAEFLLKKYSDPKQEINIAELTGTNDSTPASGRSKGLRDGLAGHPNFKIVYSKSGDFMRSKGQEITGELLSEHENIDVIYSHNDSMTMGALDAMKKLGLSPGRDIAVITIDAEQAAIDALKAGEVNCVIECNPNLGPIIMEVAKKLQKGESVPKNIYTEETVFTEWDDFDLIQPRGY